MSKIFKFNLLSYKIVFFYKKQSSKFVIVYFKKKSHISSPLQCFMSRTSAAVPIFQHQCKKCGLTMYVVGTLSFIAFGRFPFLAFALSWKSYQTHKFFHILASLLILLFFFCFLFFHCCFFISFHLDKKLFLEGVQRRNEIE